MGPMSTYRCISHSRRFELNKSTARPLTPRRCQVHHEPLMFAVPVGGGGGIMGFENCGSVA